MYIEPDTIQIYETALRDLDRQLTSLERERHRILALRDSLREYVEAHRQKTPAWSVIFSKHTDDLAGFTLMGAVKRFLEVAGTPKTFAEIEAGLKNGGYSTTSKNLVGLIRPAVYKAVKKANGAGDAIVKMNGGWGLKSWEKNERQINQGPILFPARDTESALVEKH